jgi:hypothetical protein
MQMQLHGLNMTPVSIEQLRATLWQMSNKNSNAVKDKTGNSLKTMGQTIGKYQQAWRFKSHVCKSRKEDGLYCLTTIEIAKAQKKDHLIYSKKMQKHQNWISIFILLKT